MALIIITLLGLLSLSLGSQGAAYVPGTPGAEWTEQEMLAVKHLLHQVMMNPRKALELVPKGPISALNGRNFTGKKILNRYDHKIDEGVHLQDAALPDLPKIIRLAFHDCLPDSETGGCNGCLNFANMGREGEGVKHHGCNRDQTCKEDKLAKETDNNNLLWVARVLEMIYEYDKLELPLFTKDTPEMYKDLPRDTITGSLKETGKSRADLWAFAGMTAVELGVQFHNSICDEDNMNNYCGGNPDNEDCAVELPLPIFKFGRKDCIPKCTGFDSFYDFCTPEEESHPDPQGNGTSVTSFFEEEFGLTAKESVALMGAHTLGHPNEQISAFRHYPWTFGFGKRILNNDYYKMLTKKETWRRKRQQTDSKWGNKCQSQVSSFYGDEYGRPVRVYWVARSQWQNNDGGPWNWSPFAKKCDYRICKSIKDNQELAVTSCCHYFDELGRCTNVESQCNKNFCDQEKDSFNCTMPSFMGASMMNVDMGLYVQFDIAQGDDSGMGYGRPAGCAGFNNPDWLANKNYRAGSKYKHVKLPTFSETGYLEYSSKKITGVLAARHSDVIPGKRFSGCGLNTAVTETGQKMHEVVEEYAANNSLFIKDFSDVFQKMISNGYQANNPKNNEPLRDSSWQWANMRCGEKYCMVRPVAT